MAHSLQLLTRNPDTSGKPKINLHLIIPIIALALVVLVVALLFTQRNSTNSPQIVSQTFLQEIVATSKMSTYEAVYNGVAHVSSDENPEEILYHVSYNGTIKAGFDFSKVNIQIDHQNKQVLVTLPIAKITQTSVDITSMDFIFLEEKANTEAVSQQAYAACVKDLTRESVEQPAIRQLARQNAENAILALIDPFVAQLGDEYAVKFE